MTSNSGPGLLAGRTALVTGATQGVGRAIAIALSRAGASLAIHGLHDDENARQTLSECRGYTDRAELFTSDLAQRPETTTHELWSEAVQKLGPIDLLVNNAGTFIDVPFLEMDSQTLEKTFRLNVFAYYFLAQAAARAWAADECRGRMLLIGSINGRLAEPDHTAYDASKGAVEMLVKSLCVSLAPLGIRVNGLAPGLFHTPLTAPALADPGFVDWMRQHTPNGEVPNAEVCGEAAVFLLSDHARHIHGHMLMVDGGMSIWQQPDPQ